LFQRCSRILIYTAKFKDDLRKMAKQVTCDDGFQLKTNDENELVSMVMQHSQKQHNKSMSREEVLGMAQEVA
jgi:predicted small metal-binding protein